MDLADTLWLGKVKTLTQTLNINYAEIFCIHQL